MSDAVDLLPKLLLPLAGPEEFDEEDNDKLPIDLQYLGEEKTREQDPDIRKMLLEALTQVLLLRPWVEFIKRLSKCFKKLCATKYGREYLRSKNTYVILRELHKWEKNDNVLAVLEHLVNIVIRYYIVCNYFFTTQLIIRSIKNFRFEHEIGYDNLKKEVEVPEEITEKFNALEPALWSAL